jgi:hypothetical protein
MLHHLSSLTGSSILLLQVKATRGVPLVRAPEPSLERLVVEQEAAADAEVGAVNSQAVNSQRSPPRQSSKARPAPLHTERSTTLSEATASSWSITGTDAGHPPLASPYPVRPPAMHKVANRNGFGTGRQKMALGRWTNPKLSRRTCTCEYGLQSRRGKSAGVAKRPRELISHPKSLPLRFATSPSLHASRGRRGRCSAGLTPRPSV